MASTNISNIMKISIIFLGLLYFSGHLCLTSAANVKDQHQEFIEYENVDERIEQEQDEQFV